MGLTILVVEDDLVFRQKVLAPRLVELGYEVVEVGKVREALAYLEQCPADLLIVDGLLPDRTGIDLIQSLKKQGDTTPVIFLSAFWKDMKTFQQLKQLGVAHVLHKPVEIEDLCRKVDQVLRGIPESEEEPEGTGPQVFDRGVLERLFGYDREVIQELVQGYLETIPEMVGELEGALGAKDLDKTAYHAHSIKGAAANLGGLRLQQLAAEIEGAARAADDATCRARASRLRQELELLTRELSGSRGGG